MAEHLTRHLLNHNPKRCKRNLTKPRKSNMGNRQEQKAEEDVAKKTSLRPYKRQISTDQNDYCFEWGRVSPPPSDFACLT